MDLRNLPMLLAETSKLYLGILTEELAKCGITRPQILVVDQVKESPKTIGEISKAIDLSYSTVSGIVDRLERAKIVERKKDEKDRRIVWVTLVENSEHIKEIPFMQEDYFPELFDGLTEEQIAQAVEMLTVLHTYVEKKHGTLCRERSKER